MDIKNWLIKVLSGKKNNTDLFEDEEFQAVLAEIYVRELAFWSSVNIIANAVSKCEFKTFHKNEEVRKNEYYLWNIEPNKNQNASEFIHKLIAQLYLKNEALVIEQSGQLLVADSYGKKKTYALYENVFEQVTIGDFTFTRDFQQSEVMFFKLYSKDMRRVVNGLYEMYRKLLEMGMNKYKKAGGIKGILDIDAQALASKDFQKRITQLKNEDFKALYHSDNAVLPLFDGYSFTELSKGSGASGVPASRDIRAMIDDVSDFTGMALSVPPILLTGKVINTEKAIDQLLTGAVDPLCRMMQKEINRKRSGYAAFSSGTYLQIDTRGVKHIEVLEVSTAIDKLISSGVFCVNDIRVLLGLTRIEEPWADEHFMTKNYATMEEAVAALKGGVKDEK